MEADTKIEGMEGADNVDTVEADIVEMKQSCAMNVFGDEVNMDQAAVGIVRAEKVYMKDSFALIVSGDEIEGEPRALFSPTSALIAGGAVLVGMLGYLLWTRR